MISSAGAVKSFVDPRPQARPTGVEGSKGFFSDGVLEYL